MNTEVFISYRRKDSILYAKKIYSFIKEKYGNNFVFMDTSSILPGSDWPHELKIALSKANTFLVIIGPKWFSAGINEFQQRAIDNKNDWVRREILFSLKNKKRIIPILVGGASMPPKIALPKCINSLSKKQAIRIRDSFLVEDINSFIYSTWPKVNLYLPPKLPFGDYLDKVERKDEINWINNRFKVDNIAILYGIAGIGKTFLAGMFSSFQNFPDGYISVFVGERKIEEVAFEILKHFKYNGYEPKSKMECSNLLRQYLAGSYSGLLILDNVENSSVNYLIPDGNVKTLITTRHRSIALRISSPNAIFELKKFSAKQSIELLSNYIEISNENELIKLSKFFGYLPYLIRIAATLLSEDPTLKPTDLIDQYGNEDHPIQDVHKGVYELLNKSFNLLNEKEKELLICLGYCSLKGIMLSLFCTIFEFSYSEYRKLLFRPNRFNLLEISKSSTIKIHPITKLFLQLEDQEYSKIDRYLKGLYNYIKYSKNQIDYYFINEVRSCFESIVEKKIDLYFNIIDILLLDLNFRSSRYVISDIIIKLIKKSLEIKLPQKRYIKYYFEVSKQFKLINNYNSSLKYIDIYIKATHENIYLAKALHFKGSILAEEKNYDKALKHFNESYKIFDTLNDHKGVADSYNKIGLTLAKKGEHEKALDYYVKAFDVVKNKTYSHFQLAEIEENIAYSYFDIGVPKQAIKHWKNVLSFLVKQNDSLEEVNKILKYLLISSTYDDWNKLKDFFYSIFNQCPANSSTKIEISSYCKKDNLSKSNLVDCVLFINNDINILDDIMIVIYRLHPTFPVQYQQPVLFSIEENNFPIFLKCWGSFDIDIFIIFKNHSCFEYTYFLNIFQNEEKNE